jgi:hypothetical protein
MGFLKKIFKPVSKVLDKVIPNEIKPALPYLAAFAPMFGPTSAMMGSGIMQRALLSGGMNIFGQLAQEGNEGDINLLSAGLGALSGAMTAPGTPGTPDRFIGPAEKGFMIEGTPATTGFQDFAAKGINRYGADSAMGEILTGASKASKFMTDPGLMKYGIPAAQGTGDLMFAQAKRDQDEYDRMMEEDAASDAASDAQRAFAIRRAMEATGATEEEIEDAIYAAGYKTGGRVGFEVGGLSALLGAAGKGEEESKYITKKSDTSETDTINRIYEEQGGDGLSAYLERNPDLKDKYVIVTDGMSGELTIMENKLHPDFLDMENIIDMSSMLEEKKAKGGRVGLRFGGIGDAVENIEDAEMKESVKFAMQDMDIPIMDLVEEFEIQFKRKPNSMEELKQFYKDRYEYKGPGDVKMKEEIKEKVVMEAKDGGLMNLGGKEMDLRKGGFVPIGKKERADDVPARLSKNEFVMTADAVRAAGGGSVNEGAKRMYKVMNDLEARA